MFRKLLDQGQAGDNVGILLRGTKREERRARPGAGKPGSIKPHTHFTGRGVRASRKKAAVTRRSSTTTVRSSTSARRT